MTPTNLRGEYWGIECPSMAFGLMINNYGDESELMYMLSMEDISDGSDSEETLITKKLPSGTWQIICLSGECGEEQAKEIVWVIRNYDPETFLDAIFADVSVDTYLQSLHSLLRSKNLPEKTTLILKKQ